MRVTLLGTGCPVVDLKRAGPATLVDHAGDSVLVDCGAGVTHRLLEAGHPGRELGALFLTHLHSDHIVDLFQLVISSWHQGRARPWRVFGPPGTRHYVSGLMALWKPELEQRIAHECRPSSSALEVEVIEFSDDEEIAIGALNVRTVRVDHAPVRHAFGFVFEAPGQRAVVSGDTRRCAALIEAARGADLLVHEVFVHREMKIIEGVRTQQGVDNVASYHTLSSEVGGIARDAGVRALALTHFVPPGADRAQLLAEVRSDFQGPVLIGEDLMSIDLDTMSVQHRDLHLALGGMT